MTDTLGVGTVDAPVNDGGAAPEQKPPESSPGPESGAPESGEQAGADQEGSDGSSANAEGGRRRGKSVYSQMREIQSRQRERDSYFESKFGALNSTLEEIRNSLSGGRQQQKPGKTFWEAPDEAIEERLTTHLSDFEKRIASKFDQTQVQREQAAARQQEVSEAAKFIRTQKGMTQDDIEDIREILSANPQLENLSPMDQAEFALYKWQKERGITDKSAAKARASSPSGAPPQGSGPKTWTTAEINAELAKFPQDPAKYTPEQEARFKQLDDEWRRAYRENRVTK